MEGALARKWLRLCRLALWLDATDIADGCRRQLVGDLRRLGRGVLVDHGERRDAEDVSGRPMRQVPRVCAFGDMNSELFRVQEHVPWEKGRHAREHEAGRPQCLVANDDLSYP